MAESPGCIGDPKHAGDSEQTIDSKQIGESKNLGDFRNPEQQPEGTIMSTSKLTLLSTIFAIPFFVGIGWLLLKYGPMLLMLTLYTGYTVYSNFQ